MTDPDINWDDEEDLWAQAVELTKLAEAVPDDVLDDDVEGWIKEARAKNPRVVELATAEQKKQGVELEADVFGGRKPKLRNHRMFGVYDGAELVAMTRVNLDPLKEWKNDLNYEHVKALAPDVAISATAVSPSHRRKGLAGALRRKLQREYSSIITGIGTHSEREAMERLNKKTGFKQFWKQGPNSQYSWSKGHVEKTAGAIDFPKSEHASLKARLDDGRAIYTTRISAERGKYSAGDSLKSPFGTLEVESVRPGVGIDEHPFKAELTAGQRRQIGSHEYDLVRLVKTAAAPKHVYITGLPGAGKTTEAKRLSQELGLPMVSLDGISAKAGRWSTDADARRFIKKNLDEPHVIEGSQILGFREKDLKGHTVYLIEQPRDVLVDRLVQRGWNDDAGKLHKGKGERKATEKWIDGFGSVAEDFKNTHSPTMLKTSGIRDWFSKFLPGRPEPKPEVTRDDREAARQRFLDRYSEYYNDFDGAHGPGHRDDVVRTAKLLSQIHDPKRQVVAEAAALLHDIGISVGRDRHEHHAVDMLKADPEFKKAFGFLDRRRILHAVRHHRNSTGKPRSVLAKIISDADRTPGSGDTSPMARGLAYGRAHHPDLSEDEQLMRVGKVVSEKFAPGSVRTYMPETADLIATSYGPILDAYAAGDLDALRALGDGQMKAAGVTRLAFADELEKIARAGHVIKRLNERAPGVDSALLPEIEAAANRQDLDPQRSYHAPLPGGAYVVLGPVGKKGDQRHVIKTVLSPEMRPPGRMLKGMPRTVGTMADWKAVNSSNLEATRYDAGNKRLEVKFKGGGHYGYKDVPPAKARGIRRAKSAGKYFHRNIKGTFDFDKVAQVAFEDELEKLGGLNTKLLQRLHGGDIARINKWTTTPTEKWRTFSRRPKIIPPKNEVIPEAEEIMRRRRSGEALPEATKTVVGLGEKRMHILDAPAVEATPTIGNLKELADFKRHEMLAKKGLPSTLGDGPVRTGSYRDWGGHYSPKVSERSIRRDNNFFQSTPLNYSLADPTTSVVARSEAARAVREGRHGQRGIVMDKGPTIEKGREAEAVRLAEKYQEKIVEPRRKYLAAEASKRMLSGRHAGKPVVGQVQPTVVAETGKPIAGAPGYDPERVAYRGQGGAVGPEGAGHLSHRQKIKHMDLSKDRHLGSWKDPGATPASQPRWITAHPDVASGYTGGVGGHKAPPLEQMQSPGRLSALDVEKMPGAGPWTPHLSADPRGWSKARLALNSAAQPVVSAPLRRSMLGQTQSAWGRSPTYERVVPHGEMQSAVTHEYKKLPDGRMMLVRGKGETSPIPLMPKKSSILFSAFFDELEKLGGRKMSPAEMGKVLERLGKGWMPADKEHLRRVLKFKQEQHVPLPMRLENYKHWKRTGRLKEIDTSFSSPPSWMLFPGVEPRYKREGVTTLLSGGREQNLRNAVRDPRTRLDHRFLIPGQAKVFTQGMYATPHPEMASRFAGRGNPDGGVAGVATLQVPNKLMVQNGAEMLIPSSAGGRIKMTGFSPSMSKGASASLPDRELEALPKKSSILFSAFDDEIEKHAASVTTELLPHQQRVLDKLDRSGGVLVVHGLGSGKTLTSIAAGAEGEEPLEVVVPASLQANYEKEVEKHTEGDLPRRIRSYAIASRDGIDPASLVVMDEAHRLRNTGTKRYRALSEPVQSAIRRLLLTGTPIYNAPSDLAPLANMAAGEDVLPVTPQVFNRRFIRDVRVRPSFAQRLLGVRAGVRPKLRNRDQLVEALTGHIDVHEPDQGDFPGRRDEVVEVPMSRRQKSVYDYLLNKAPISMRAKIRAGLPPSKQESRSLNSFLAGVRQASGSPRPYVDEMTDEGEDENTPKIQRAVEALLAARADDPNFRALVYSNYLGAGLDPYSRRLDAEGILHSKFTGAVSKAKRAKMVEDYNAGETPVLLVSSSGGEGLDLKGTKLVQVLEPHFNNPKVEQVIGRGRRYQSHSHLPENEREVLVQRFLSVLPKKRGAFGGNKKNTALSTDQWLQRQADIRDKLTGEFMKALRAASDASLDKAASAMFEGFGAEFDKLAAEKKYKEGEPAGLVTPGGTGGVHALQSRSPLSPVEVTARGLDTKRGAMSEVAHHALDNLNFSAPGAKPVPGVSELKEKYMALPVGPDGLPDYETAGDEWKADIAEAIEKNKAPQMAETTKFIADVAKPIQMATSAEGVAVRGVLPYEGSHFRTPRWTGPIAEAVSTAFTGHKQDKPEIATARSSGVAAHEIGHAMNAADDTEAQKLRHRLLPVTGPTKNSAKAAEEALASFRGQQELRNSGVFRGMAEEKSWGAYAGLPTYVAHLEPDEVTSFYEQVDGMEKDYPGIGAAVRTALDDYKGRVLPALVNQPGKAWSPEATEALRLWREKHGVEGEMSPGRLYDVLEGTPEELGPFSALEPKGGQPKRASAMWAELGAELTAEPTEPSVESPARSPK